MAKAIYEKRQFTNRSTGEILQYDAYVIVGEDESGEKTELPLKNLNAAEKIAFKQIAALNDPTTIDPSEVKTHKGGDVNITKTILDEDDDEKKAIWD